MGLRYSGNGEVQIIEKLFWTMPVTKEIAKEQKMSGKIFLSRYMTMTVIWLRTKLSGKTTWYKS